MKPYFWKTTIDEMNDTISLVKKGTVSVLAKSAGGREIPAVTYGGREYFNRTANYNSACGAKDPVFYADKKGKKNTVLIAGGIHATEFEGISSCLNLIKLIETGTDYLGVKHAFADDINVRLIIIPIMNADGRARQPVDTLLGLSKEQSEEYTLAKWNDGRVCHWPECKAFHPLPLSEMAHVGGYYNDNGVNFMHDDFFGEMQPETKALLKLVSDEAPDFTLLLHSGGDMPSTMLQPSYVPTYIAEKLYELSVRVKIAADARGLRAGIDNFADRRFSYPTHSLNLTSAIHHNCGGVATTYESESIASEDMYEKILRMHYTLFEETFKIDRAET